MRQGWIIAQLAVLVARDVVDLADGREHLRLFDRIEAPLFERADVSQRDDFVAAQAGFLDGPRILANMATDSWVPRRFAQLSDRLVTKNGTLLMGAAALGIRNLLLITGDPPKMGPYPDATAVFDIDAIGLTNMVNKLNHGLDIGNNPIGEPTACSTTP